MRQSEPCQLGLYLIKGFGKIMAIPPVTRPTQAVP